MKYLKYVLSVALCVCLVSCYEMNEEIEINADGSGTYVTKMDMGQMIDMMQTFAGEEKPYGFGQRCHRRTEGTDEEW
jgi:hypothetical protein